MFIFFTAYWTLHYIAPCTVFYMYDCAFVTFFIKGYLTWLERCIDIRQCWWCKTLAIPRTFWEAMLALGRDSRQHCLLGDYCKTCSTCI